MAGHFLVFNTQPSWNIGIFQHNLFWLMFTLKGFIIKSLRLIVLIGFSRETELKGYIQIYIRGDLLQELAHVIMGNKNSHDLLSAPWRPRKAGGVQSENEGLITREDDGVSPGPKS